MNSVFSRTNKFIMLPVSIMLICCMMFLYIVIGLLTNTDYVHRKVNDGNHHTTSNVIDNNTLKIKDYNEQHLMKDNIIMIIQSIFDEEFFKKCLSTYFNNSMLFAAFIEISISSLLVVLRNNRRRYFEETHYINFLNLIKYIHRMDGERGNISLSYSL